MKKQKLFQRFAAMALAIALAMSLTPAASAASSRMDNFKKKLTYSGFSDVSENAWYAKDVRAVYELGFMNGKSKNKFDPSGQLTVAEAITLAVRVSAIYYGVPFTSGGTPWYQNAVDFAERHYIISEGQFTQADYNRPATRAEVAMLLFETISISDFDRINRITYIPDITPQTAGWNEIYLLYNAGVLTGKGTMANGQLTGDMAGSFFPDDTVTRAEAAAIMHRVAVPSQRVSFNLSGHRPGEVVTAADNSFRISIPKNEGWELRLNRLTDNDSGVFHVSQKDGGSQMRVMTLLKEKYDDWTIEDMADYCVPAGIDTWWKGTVDTESGGEAIVRGLRCYCYNYSYNEDGENFSGLGFCAENQEFFYVFFLSWPEDDTEEQFDLLAGLLLSLDMAL